MTPPPGGGGSRARTQSVTFEKTSQSPPGGGGGRTRLKQRYACDMWWVHKGTARAKGATQHTAHCQGREGHTVKVYGVHRAVDLQALGNGLRPLSSYSIVCNSSTPHTTHVILWADCSAEAQGGGWSAKRKGGFGSLYWITGWASHGQGCIVLQKFNTGGDHQAASTAQKWLCWDTAETVRRWQVRTNAVVAGEVSGANGWN